MEKQWQVLPKISSTEAAKFSNYQPLVLQLFFNRGIQTSDEIAAWLADDYSVNIHDPFLFTAMEQATATIIKHIKTGNKIFVYGDYDADGVTASAILYEILRLLKAQVDVYIPDRLLEGYGLNQGAIDVINDENAKLIITVDCGIRDQATVAYAKSKGIEVIITDHHVPPEDETKYPNCLIIDPALPQEKYPYKYLSGAGVSLKLAQALLMKSKLTLEQKELATDKLMDLLVIGIVADIVSVNGENRALLKQGIIRLNKTKRKGLKELIKIAKLAENKNLDTWNIAFQLAPRINAAGRMDHANTAFELLIVDDQKLATKLAYNLNQKNSERQQLTEEIYTMIDKQVAAQAKDKIIVGVCEINKQEEADIWNEGVIGLVASRICEQYYRPTLVITKTSQEYKGSGRSIPEFNIIKAVEACAKLLLKYGGHPGACGLSIAEEQLPIFIKKIKKIAADKLRGMELIPKLIIDAELPFTDINLDLITTIGKFAPFGKDNERPKFVTYNVNIADIINMGVRSQHLKLKLKTDNSLIFNALGFGQSERWQHLHIGDVIDIVYYVEVNVFNGRSEIQLKIIDIKKHKL